MDSKVSWLGGASLDPTAVPANVAALHLDQLHVEAGAAGSLLVSHPTAYSFEQDGNRVYLCLQGQRLGVWPGARRAFGADVPMPQARKTLQWRFNRRGPNVIIIDHNLNDNRFRLEPAGARIAGTRHLDTNRAEVDWYFTAGVNATLRAYSDEPGAVSLIENVGGVVTTHNYRKLSLLAEELNHLSAFARTLTGA